MITGEGRAFSAGVDTRSFAASDPQDRAALILAITRTLTLLYGLPFPVVTAVGGHAMGGGFVVTLTGDVRLAVDDPAIRWGCRRPRPAFPSLQAHWRSSGRNCRPNCSAG